MIMHISTFSFFFRLQIVVRHLSQFLLLFFFETRSSFTIKTKEKQCVQKRLLADSYYKNIFNLDCEGRFSQTF